MSTRALSLLASATLLGALAAAGRPASPQTAAAAPAPVLAPGARFVDDKTIEAEKNFLSGWEPRTEGGGVRAVVEIPAGRLDKWEVKNEDGLLHWDIKEGKPRVVKYLGYPVNYVIGQGTPLAGSRGR